MRKLILIVAAVATLTALLVGPTLVGPAGAQAATPQARFATGLVHTDGLGFAPVVYVKHSGACRSLSINLADPPEECRLPLTDRPDVINVTGVAPMGGAYSPSQVMADGFGTTQFRVRVRNPNGSLLTNQTVRISFRATSDPDGYCDTNICS
jgi:hypothetical protein